MRAKVYIASTLLLAAPLQAQTLRPMLDYASAAKIRDTCVAWAGKLGKPMAVAVMDTRGMLVSFAHMDGASTQVGDVARWKAGSSSKSGRATADTAKLNPPANMPNVATLGGGVPIFTRDGVALGGVGTSGGSPDEDAACGTAGVEAAGLTTARPAPPAPPAPKAQ